MSVESLPILIAIANLSGKILAGVLWVGFGGLTIALIVLMRTRWGTAQPLAKCAVLSVYAHVLLMTYAYCTYLTVPTNSGNGNGDDNVIQVSLVAGADDGATSRETPVAPPWEPTPATSKTDTISLDEPMTPKVEKPAEEAKPKPEPVVEKPVVETPAKPIPMLVLDKPSKPSAQSSQSVPLTSDEVETFLPTPVGPTRPMIAPSIAQETPPLTNDPKPVESPMDASVANSQPTPRDLEEVRILQGTSSAPIVHELLAHRIPRRTADGAPMPLLYRLRVGPNRQRLASRFGATKESDKTVEQALAWLAANQSADGRWNAKQYGAGEERKTLGQDRQGAGADADTGITGLSLLALMGAGHTHLEGAHREIVQRGLEFLCRAQKPDGSLSGDAKLYATMYCHGMATLALSEAFAMTGDTRLEPYVKKAAGYTLKSQHSGTGGWRYQPGDQGDMSQFGWQVLALKSAEFAGVGVPDKSRQGMLKFLQNNSSGKFHGLASYRTGERPSRTMTAEAYACRVMLNTTPSAELTNEAAMFVIEHLPGKGDPDFYYWYYGSLALFQLQDERWEKWNAALQKELISRQVTSGELAGSYATDEVWSGYGGRVYTTAMAALCLEVYYRYLPIYGTKTADATLR